MDYSFNCPSCGRKCETYEEAMPYGAWDWEDYECDSCGHHMKIGWEKKLEVKSPLISNQDQYDDAGILVRPKVSVE